MKMFLIRQLIGKFTMKIINKIINFFKKEEIDYTPKKSNNGLTYVMAEYKYACYIRDELKGSGPILYPSEQASKQQTDGSWLLLTITGERLGTVSPNGTVRLT